MKLVKLKIGVLIVALGASSAAVAHINGWGGGGRRESIVCYARNAEGYEFQARGRGPEQWIQDEAVRRCRVSPTTRRAKHCRALGCSRW